MPEKHLLLDIRECSFYIQVPWEMYSINLFKKVAPGKRTDIL